MRKDNFEFWCELNQVEKAVDEKTGEEIMLLGGIALFPEKYSDCRTKSVVGYMRRHILTVLRHHRKIGFSLVGSLMLLLPTKWYMSYRHSKI